MFIENRKERIGELVEKVDTAIRKRQLSMNAKKTKLSTLGGNKAEIKVRNEKDEEVEHFQYLGSLKTRSNKLETSFSGPPAATGKNRVV